MSRLLDSAGVPVVTDAAMYQDAFYDPKTQRITVSTRLTDSKTFAALSREIVHAGIHEGADAGPREKVHSGSLLGVGYELEIASGHVTLPRNQ